MATLTQDFFFTSGQACWIWSPEGSWDFPPADTSRPYGVRRFRRSFIVKDPAQVQLRVAISADSRYVFYCNGQRLGRGPAKGDTFHQFFETYDLTLWLQAGENVLAALVLDFSKVDTFPPRLGAPTSVMTHAGGFILDGDLRSAADGTVLASLATRPDSAWKVQVDEAYSFQNEQNLFGGFVGYFEHFSSAREPKGWMRAGFDDGAWLGPVSVGEGSLLSGRRDDGTAYGLLPRMISLLEEEDVLPFSDAFSPGGAPLAGPAHDWVFANRPLTLAPGEELRLILDAGALTTAYPMLTVEQGLGAQIRLTYAEALRLPVGTPDALLLQAKADQSCIVAGYSDQTIAWTFDRRGAITGWCDRYEPSGAGETWEPLHWRSFRYIELHAKAGAEPLRLTSFRHRFTAYPFTVAASYRDSEPRHERYWDVSLRTMRLCAHETFEDCPYYEQMQYAGDSEVTSRLAMLVSGDSRLTRQALYHFDWSRLSEGITQSRYPSRLNQIIPSFSLHWITMVRDYFLFTGDRATLLDLLPGMHAVLDWFRRYVDTSGLPARLPYWNCTDWCTDWQRGSPPGWDAGPTGVISAQYLYALRQVRWMEEQGGAPISRPGLSAEIERVTRAINDCFWSEAEGLYFDRPGGPELSQLGNAWAVLSGAADPARQQQMLARFPDDPRLSRAAFFGLYFVMRALRTMGADAPALARLAQWDEMLDLGLSTWAEETTYWRSLCHAWSAHPVLDFLTQILGIQPLAPGFAKIRVAPRPSGLQWAEGALATPRGRVAVRWEMRPGELWLKVHGPAATPIEIVPPAGPAVSFEGGEFEERFALASLRAATVKG